MPDLPSRSAIARAAGTTAQPGWAFVTGSKSSVSSAWANMPLTKAAFTAEVLISVVMMVASATPPCARA
jgi:hypothetical protein